MKIYRVIADKKPMFCCECPFNVSVAKVDTLNCGSMQTVIDGGIGWKIGGKAPDERCLITTLEESRGKK